MRPSLPIKWISQRKLVDYYRFLSRSILNITRIGENVTRKQNQGDSKV